jgi:anti-sigma regulatory factor (Ser/Thr protein kinase)
MSAVANYVLAFRSTLSSQPVPPCPGRGLARIRSAGGLARLLDEVGMALEQEGFCRKDRHAVRLSLEEAVVNGLKHGNGGDRAREVRVWWAVSSSGLRAVVEDQGAGFDPVRCLTRWPRTTSNGPAAADCC